MYDAAARLAIPLAKKLKTKYGDAAGVCSAKNISVHEQPLADGVHGLHLCYKNQHVILINNNCDPYAVRFTLGHELGHYFMDKASCSYFIDRHSYKHAPRERRADIFSAALILPDKIPEEFDDYTADQLSSYYGVPAWTIPTVYKGNFF